MDKQSMAVRRKIAKELREMIRRRKLPTAEAAHRLGVTPAQFRRLQDPRDDQVTLTALFRAATAVGLQLQVLLVEISNDTVKT